MTSMHIHASWCSVVSLIHETGPDCGKPRLLSWLMRTIEDLFDLR